MIRKEWITERGKVVYWISDNLSANKKTLAFLPGLSAEHHLFDEQFKHYEDTYNIFTWDAPAHAESRLYAMDFTLMEDAEVLHDIFEHENIEKPVLIGQSFGAYISQMYMELYHDTVSGFVSIDSAPLQLKYYTNFYFYFLERIEPMSLVYPNLVRSIVKVCSVTERGQKNMYYALSFYDKKELCKLNGRGYLALCEAIKQNKPYKIDCPALLICGKKDNIGVVKSYNKRWSKDTGIKLIWVENAAHNSNIDQPEFVNKQIDEFLKTI